MRTTVSHPLPASPFTKGEGAESPLPWRERRGEGDGLNFPLPWRERVRHALRSSEHGVGEGLTSLGSVSWPNRHSLRNPRSVRRDHGEALPVADCPKAISWPS